MRWWHTPNTGPHGGWVQNTACDICPENTFSAYLNPGWDIYDFRMQLTCSMCPNNTISAIGSNSYTDCQCNTAMGWHPQECVETGECYNQKFNDHWCSQTAYSETNDCERCKCSCSHVGGKCPMSPENARCVHIVGPCGPGYTGPDGQCAPCNAGTYKNTNGSEACTTCTPGSVSPKAAATVCTLCEAGSYGISATTCALCAANTFEEDRGSAACSLCPADYNSSEGSTSFMDCSCYAPADGASLTCSGTCQCNPILSGKNGIISDGPVSYPYNANCQWLFSSNDIISVIFAFLDVENDRDYVNVDKCTTAACGVSVRVLRYTGRTHVRSSVYQSDVDYPFLRITLTSNIQT